MDREKALTLAGIALGQRKLVWVGKRGMDVASLAELAQFSGCFSMLAPLQSPGVYSLAIEDLTGVRDELYDLDGVAGDHGRAFVRALSSACEASAVLLAYRPYEFLTAPEWSHLLARYHGPSYAEFYALGHKPAVEQALATAFGVPTIPWSYVAGPNREDELARALETGPIVLRAERSSGGEGLELIRQASGLCTSRLTGLDAPIAWAPFLAGYAPVNVAGCVFGDGGVTLHTPSVQLIGLPLCTPLPLGYCGNDFGAVAELEPAGLQTLERVARAVGSWLWKRGYRGAFGLDAMVGGREVLFTEINSRFQGSSRVSAELDRRCGRPDVILDHAMAVLGMPSYETPSIEVLAREQDGVAQVICYNLDAEAVRLPEPPAQLEGATVSLLPRQDVAVAHNSAMFVLDFERSVTRDGLSLAPEAAAIVEAVLGRMRDGRVANT